MYERPNKENLKAIWELNLTNQKPSDETITKIEEFRAKAKELSAWIIDNVEGREQSLALTNLEQMSFYAVAGLVRGAVPLSVSE